MKRQLAGLFVEILREIGVKDISPDIEIPENPAHGDYTTNVAMKIATSSKWQSPMEMALWVVEKIKNQKSKIKSEGQDPNIHQKHQISSPILPLLPLLQAIDRVEVAPPGFINIYLTEAALSSRLDRVLNEKEAYGLLPSRPSGPSRPSQTVMVEFAHPNTHKAFHIGHVRNITTGESIVRLLESQGARVIRANYQGDVGMHIAKCLYGILQAQSSKLKAQSWKSVARLPINEKVEYLGKMYVAGSKAYEEDEKAKAVIVDLNAKIYAAAQRFHKEKGLDTGSFDYLSLVKGSKTDIDEVYKLWKETRQWSLDYFETIYKRLGSHFDRYYFESECLSGLDRAKEAVKRGVLKESEGAIIFDGKPYGLDTRVFVNSLGLPTYEAKELALAAFESAEFAQLAKLIHVVGPEQGSFFKVTFKAEELLGILPSGVQHHLAYGWVRLKKGKMSSRMGNVVLGEWLLDSLKQKIYNILNKSTTPTSPQLPLSPRYSKEEKDEIAEKAAVAAVKYSFLRVSTSQEIAFDLDESINFEGDSGPYLLYTYARAKSVLRKSSSSPDSPYFPDYPDLNPEERLLARYIFHFPDVVASAAEHLAPSTLCKYLFELAQAFNLFYAKHEILGSPSRLALTAATAQVLKNGLYLLGIETVERM